MNSLHEQTALVTGASRGIGRAIALALGAEGMRLGLVARSRDALEDVAAEVRARGGHAQVAACDLAEPAAVSAAAELLCSQFGRVDCLVNNAAVFLEQRIEDLTTGEWERALQVNVTAPLTFCRAVLPRMKEAGGGRIINIGSTASTQGYLHQAAYCASKHALLGLARVLAIEGKPHGIHVHTLCPGGVETGLIEGTHLGRRLEGQPKLQPEDVAGQVLFLLRQPDRVDIAEIVTRRFAP